MILLQKILHVLKLSKGTAILNVNAMYINNKFIVKSFHKYNDYILRIKLTETNAN